MGSQQAIRSRPPHQQFDKMDDDEDSNCGLATHLMRKVDEASRT
jgi:hypothetical protein